MKGRRILIVDEHAGSRFVLGLALELRGHVCHLDRNADDALRTLTWFHPDAVIFEWYSRAGIGLAARLRALAAANGREPIIVVTSTQTEPDGFREREDVDHYVTKPVALAMIDDILDCL